MSISNSPETLKLFSIFMDSNSENDLATAQKFLNTISPQAKNRLNEELSNLINTSSASIDEIGAESNRWFADQSEVKEWLQNILEVISQGIQKSNQFEVKDSHGTVLNEGDSVTVIKDLKVKGGSSDLKRGTLIKKIHLVDDPEVIECRVEGSALVLKTCFLKKA